MHPHLSKPLWKLGWKKCSVNLKWGTTYQQQYFNVHIQVYIRTTLETTLYMYHVNALSCWVSSPVLTSSLPSPVFNHSYIDHLLGEAKDTLAISLNTQDCALSYSITFTNNCQRTFSEKTFTTLTFSCMVKTTRFCFFAYSITTSYVPACTTMINYLHVFSVWPNLPYIGLE